MIVKPLADGGEGTTDAFIEGMGGEKISLTVTGPMGNPVQACYGYLKDTQTAVMEMASAAGITLVQVQEKDPMRASTFGVGEMILHAMKKGCRKFVIGIGGSATNDGGIGMLKALGFSFLDRNGRDVGEGGQALGRVCRISSEHVAKELAECEFRIACDVNNPLCGENGATYIYGPQKGVAEEMKEKLDEAMAHFAEMAEAYLRCNCMYSPGAGAAGGLCLPS